MKLERLEGFEVFPWNDYFETGIAKIDEQHKHLVSILNQLALYLGSTNKPADLKGIFGELAAYADYHFSCEEVIWESHFRDDPFLHNHYKTHASFMVEVRKLQEASEPIDKVIDKIIKFLSHWLATHILYTDAHMAKIVLAVQEGLPLEKAKLQTEAEMGGDKVALIEDLLKSYEKQAERTIELMRQQSGRRNRNPDK